MPVAGGEPKPSAVVLQPTDTVMVWNVSRATGLIPYWRRFGCPVECQEMRLNPSV